MFLPLLGRLLFDASWCFLSDNNLLQFWKCTTFVQVILAAYSLQQTSLHSWTVYFRLYLLCSNVV